MRKIVDQHWVNRYGYLTGHASSNQSWHPQSHITPLNPFKQVVGDLRGIDLHECKLIDFCVMERERHCDSSGWLKVQKWVMFLVTPARAAWGHHWMYTFPGISSPYWFHTVRTYCVLGVPFRFRFMYYGELSSVNGVVVNISAFAYSETISSSYTSLVNSMGPILSMEVLHKENKNCAHTLAHDRCSGLVFIWLRWSYI